MARVDGRLETEDTNSFQVPRKILLALFMKIMTREDSLLILIFKIT